MWIAVLIVSAFGDRHVIVAYRVTAYNFLFIDVITDDIIILFMYLCCVLHFVSAILAIIVVLWKFGAL